MGRTDKIPEGTEVVVILYITAAIGMIILGGYAARFLGWASTAVLISFVLVVDAFALCLTHFISKG